MAVSRTVSDVAGAAVEAGAGGVTEHNVSVVAEEEIVETKVGVDNI